MVQLTSVVKIEFEYSTVLVWYIGMYQVEVVKSQFLASPCTDIRGRGVEECGAEGQLLSSTLLETLML